MHWMEFADYLVAGFMFLVGVGIGRARGPRPVVKKAATATCACEHGFGQHEMVAGSEHLGGKCSAVTQIPDRWDYYNRPSHWRTINCTCMRYDGPDPELVRQLIA